MAGQGILTAADGESAVIPVRQGFFTFDLNQSEIGLRAYRERNVGPERRTRACGVTFPQLRDHDERAFRLAFAAAEGKRALVSSGKLTPGAEASLTFVRFRELGWVPVRDSIAECPKPNAQGDMVIARPTRGYHAFALTLKGGVVARRTAEQSGDVVAFDDEVGGSVGGVLTWNRAFRNARVLGVALDVQRGFASPGDADPLDACVTRLRGVTVDGDSARVQECEERYVGPLGDETRGQLRVDWTSKLVRTQRGRGPAVGLYAAASGLARTNATTAYSLAAGPMLHPAERPSQVLGAALVELSDLTNASGRRPKLSQRLFLRLFVGLPI